MNLLYVVILSAGLALYLFSSILKVGATQPTMSKKKMAGVGAVYSITQIVLVGVGILISYVIEAYFSIESVSKVTRVIMIALLCVIIYRLFKEAFFGKTFLEKRADALTGKGSALLALQGSFEAIVVGVCVFELNQNAFIDLITVIVATFLASLIGFWYGYFYGTKGNRGIMVSSALLLVVSAVILL